MTCCCCKHTGCRSEATTTTGTSTVVPTPASTVSGDAEGTQEKPTTSEEEESKDKDSSDSESDDEEEEDEEPKPKPMKPELINLITKYDETTGEYITKPATASSLSQGAQDEYAEYAITVTSAFDRKGDFTRKILEIKAPVLNKLCLDVIGDKYPGQSFKTEKVSMTCPPKPLFYYREEFEKVRGQWKERLAVLKKEAKIKAAEEKVEAEKKAAEEKETKDAEAAPAAKEEVTVKETEKNEDEVKEVSEDVEDQDEENDDVLEVKHEEPTLKTFEDKTLDELTEDVKYINIFMRFLKSELRGEIAAYNSLIPQGLISYDIIWTIFPPHTKFLVHTHNNEPALLQLHRGVEVTEGCDPRFHLDCFGIDHDGYNWGYSAQAAEVPPFEGTLPIAALPAVPLEYLPERETVIADLIARGRKSEKLQCKGSSVMVYKGRALGPIENRRRTYYSINGRVMVDPNTFARINPYRAINITALRSANPFKTEAERDWYRDRDAFEDGYNGVRIELEVNNTRHEIQEKILDRSEKFYIALTDEQASIVHPFARGFALSEKKWAEFAVSTLEEVKWAPDAFDKLVLPEAQKELILSLVEAPTDNVSNSSNPAAAADNAKYKFDDFIQGKGLGLVTVLHGPPGVGKTLTAESVAEYTRRPLYSVTSGELGTEPGDLETKLAEILEVAGTWNAILLIDEADIFLEARTSASMSGGNSIHRNAMVGIFLRLLEYFRGVMFLTTNRVEQFDPAFKSRIHLAMRYKELTEEARVEVWRNFVEKLPSEAREEGLLEGEYCGVEKLARKWAGINGREIKNAVKTGLRIAQRRGGKLNLQILEGVLKMGGEFDASMRLRN